MIRKDARIKTTWIIEKKNFIKTKKKYIALSTPEVNLYANNFGNEFTGGLKVMRSVLAEI